MLVLISVSPNGEMVVVGSKTKTNFEDFIFLVAFERTCDTHNSELKIYDTLYVNSSN